MIWPVSVKGIIFDSQSRVLLLKNDRNEWELPGGRLEAGEQPRETVAREILEECGLRVQVSGHLEPYCFEVIKDKHVLIVPFICKIMRDSQVTISHEHVEYSYTPLTELDLIMIPEGYVRVIREAYAHFL